VVTLVFRRGRHYNTKKNITTFGAHHRLAQCPANPLNPPQVIRGDMSLIRAAEKQADRDRPVGARAMRSLTVPPERRTLRDVRNIVEELSTPKSGLDIPRFCKAPACVKTRIAAAARLEVCGSSLVHSCLRSS